MKYTYVDAGVLIAATRGNGLAATKAFAILDDPNRAFAASVFLQLEVLPKAIYFKRQNEVAFYHAFFASVQFWSKSLEKVTQTAYRIAEESGLAAIDALHVAAAIAVEAEELITTEKPNKPIHRVSGIKVIDLQSIVVPS